MQTASCSVELEVDFESSQTKVDAKDHDQGTQDHTQGTQDHTQGTQDHTRGTTGKLVRQTMKTPLPHRQL
jgi:hypothetical protein